MAGLDVLSAIVGAGALATAAWLHPGRSRGMAVATAALGLFPFAFGTAGLLRIAADVLVVDPWKIWVAGAILYAACVGLVVACATVRVERWWPVFPVLVGVGLAMGDPLTIGCAALLAAAGLPAVTRGGFGDPAHWRRIGAGVCLLALVAANALLLREALIP